MIDIFNKYWSQNKEQIIKLSVETNKLMYYVFYTFGNKRKCWLRGKDPRLLAHFFPIDECIQKWIILV